MWTHRKRVLGHPSSQAATPAKPISLAVRQSGAVGANLASAASMRPPQCPAAAPPAGQHIDREGKNEPRTLTGLYNVLEALGRAQPVVSDGEVRWRA